jgi:hypothetical protein
MLTLRNQFRTRNQFRLIPGIPKVESSYNRREFRSIREFRELLPIPEFRDGTIYLFQRLTFDQITLREGEGEK